MFQVEFLDSANAGPSQGCDTRQLLELVMERQNLAPKQEDDACTVMTSNTIMAPASTVIGDATPPPPQFAQPLQASLPIAQPGVMNVILSEDWRPGQTTAVQVDNWQVMLEVPWDATPGTMLQVTIRYVNVSDGMQPGQLLTVLDPKGQRQQVQVPVGAVPGNMFPVAFTESPNAGPSQGFDPREMLEQKMRRQSENVTAQQMDELDSDACTVITTYTCANGGQAMSGEERRALGDALVMARLENRSEHSNFMLSRTSKMKGRSNYLIIKLLDQGLRLCSDNSLRQDWCQPDWVQAYVHDAKQAKYGIMMIQFMDRMQMFSQSTPCADELYASFLAGVQITRCFGSIDEGEYTWVQVTDEVFSDDHAYERTMRGRHGVQYTPFYQTMTLGSWYNPSLAGQEYTLYQVVPMGRAAHANGADRQRY
jgi:hypothetical protein